MRRTMAMAIAGAAAGALTACHTITEDLPSRPSSIQVGAPGSIPVIVVPLPQLTPAPAPPVPSPSSPNAPNPNPTPRPTPVPGGGGEAPTTNTSPVAKVNASVYFIECGGQPVPNTSRATRAPVGCRVHLDCTPRDASNAPTIPRGTPRWTYSNPGLLQVAGSSPFNPVITAKGPGDEDIYAEVDGHRSATFSIRFE